MTDFEVVDYVPARTKNSKYGKLHIEMMQTLLKVPPGKSIRRGHSSVDEAHSYATSVKIYIKKQKLASSYFVSRPTQAEQDGRFYVYIGRRDE